MKRRRIQYLQGRGTLRVPVVEAKLEGEKIMSINKNLLALSLLLSLGSSVGMAEQASNISVVLTTKQAKALEATANTPQEHLSLSTYYRKEAHRFEQKGRYHEEMAEMYRNNPLPFDGKTAVPMQRHCKDWLSHFSEQEERAAVLATFHEEKALGAKPNANTFAQPSRWGLQTSGFGGLSTDGLMIQATAEQSSLFKDSAAASIHFYDLTRILTYVVSANAEPSIEIPELRKSAATLFDSQRQFLESLTEPQKAAVDAHLRAMQTLRRDVEDGLDRLENRAASPTSRSSFNIAKKIKGGVEKWHNEQQGIALQLGIQY